MTNSHPGSYCGQDAYNDMFVTEKRHGLLHRKRTMGTTENEQEGRGVELYARSTSCHEGGVPRIWIQLLEGLLLQSVKDFKVFLTIGH